LSVPIQPSSDQGIVDAALLASVLWPRRWLIVTFAIVGMGLFAALGFVMHPTYRGTAILVAASQDRNGLAGSLGSALGSVSQLASLAGIGGQNGTSAVDEALAVLQSHEFTEAFIASHNLMPMLFQKIWDPASNSWKVPVDKQPTPSKAFRAFDRIRSVKRDVKTDLISLQIDWRDRNQAADWANELVAALNAEMRARAIAAADASLVYLQKELASTSEIDIRDSISRLMEGQIKQRMLANVTEQYSLRFVDRALAADADEPVGPRKLLLMVVGLFLGLIGGIALSLILNSRSLVARQRERRARLAQPADHAEA
jgi:uncharacterized protein involved in exopolysaccharide biosynthesis